MDREIILAPIILFVYNRIDHTKKTVQALLNNQLADKSTLFIFSDGAKDDSETHKVNQVREYIKTIHGFKKINIINRDKNWGLADSIIDGVTKIISKYDKAIVLEDDLVSSPFFLKYMNEALDHFKEIKDVYHISGWNYPFYNDQLGDVFLWRLMNCWGWATWDDRWASFRQNQLSRDPYYLKDIFSKKMINRFNLDMKGENWWAQVESNANNKIDSWAIFWYAHIFLNDGLCLNPKNSLIKNIGLDGSGTFTIARKDVKVNLCNNIKTFNYPTNLKEDFETVEKIKDYLYKPLFIRFINKFISKIIAIKNKLLS